MFRILLALCMLIGVKASAQAYLTSYKYQKVMLQSAAIDMPYSEKIAEEAMLSFMQKRAGGKPAESKGVFVFRNTRLDQEENVDLHWAIERKSRREKDFCTIYLMAAKLNENMALRLPDEKFGLPGAQLLLNEFAPAVVAYALEVEIKNQQDNVAKANKRYASLQEDSVDLQKRKVALEDKIVTNSKDQEKQRADIQNQRLMLEALMQKRKS